MKRVDFAIFAFLAAGCAGSTVPSTTDAGGTADAGSVKGNKPASAACSADSECSSGSCLDLAMFQPDGGCTSAGKACSTSCSGDKDCAALGPKFMCFGGCGSTKFCGATP